MATEEYSGEDYFSEINLIIRDLEEKQKILKDRLLIVSENLVALKEKTTKDSLEIKKSISMMQEQMKKLVSFLEMASSEMTKFAKKEELDILYKQAKMFRPLEQNKEE
jgi:hypothetical protein